MRVQILRLTIFSKETSSQVNWLDKNYLAVVTIESLWWLRLETDKFKICQIDLNKTVSTDGEQI